MNDKVPIRILMVEDVPTDAELAERVMRKEGLIFTLQRTETEKEFLKALDDFKPDIIISDYMLPEFDGMKALKLSLSHDPLLPFVVFTGSMNEETAVECMKAGATDYVVKEHNKRLPFAVKEALNQKMLRLEKKKAEENLMLYMERLRKTFEGTIKAMSLTVETRDPYTAGHQRRVSNLAGAIAIDMGMSADSVEIIRMAGQIHDIGKIAVPAEILSKPGRLASMEMSLVKFHSHAGYDILKNAELPFPIAEIVHQHHERIDGSGYPLGLKDGDILLEARVLAVSDVVEAMSSHRPYRPLLGIKDALDEIEKNKAVLYDPDVVDSCLRLFREKGFRFE